ncbi:transporter substrate-binding domain-containing protein [Paenibacillus sp. JMULE4]|nr:transporter substrate-binding domain-containing protein [Paenibacillus sp. JMULE4]
MRARKIKTGRKMRHSGLLFMIVASLIWLQACGTVSDDSASGEPGASGIPATLNYGYIGSNKLNLPGGAEGWGFYTGIIQEELKKHGITEVTFTGFPNGPDQTESLISGRLDFGSLGDTPAIIARSTDAPTRLISQGTVGSIGYLIAKKGGPAKLEDLKGKTVATQKGSFHHRFLAGLLKKHNITDVNIVHLLRPDGEAALARGEIDAMTNTGVYALKQIEQGYPLLDDAVKNPELLGTSATVVAEKYLQKFPEFPKVWNEARQKAYEDLLANEEKYYEFVAQVYNSTVELVKQVHPISQIQAEAFTEEGLKLMEGTKQFLVEEQLAARDFDLNDWIIK